MKPPSSSAKSLHIQSLNPNEYHVVKQHVKPPYFMVKSCYTVIPWLNHQCSKQRLWIRSKTSSPSGSSRPPCCSHWGSTSETTDPLEEGPADVGRPMEANARFHMNQRRKDSIGNLTWLKHQLETPTW